MQKATMLKRQCLKATLQYYYNNTTIQLQRLNAEPSNERRNLSAKPGITILLRFSLGV